MTFFHAHLHSDFSVLDALLKVDDAAKLAAELGQPAMALTDHGTMAGLIQHYQACRKNDIIPIMGFEGYMVENASQHSDLVKSETTRINGEARKQGERKQVTSAVREAASLRRHVLLWAKNFEGYKVLCHAMSKAYAQGYYKPLLDLRDLTEIGKTGHVMMSTGCVSGEIPKLLSKDQPIAAWERLNYYRNIFGDNYVVELQFHDLADVSERFVNETLVKWATHLGMPIICTGDVHFLRETDHDVHSFYKRMSYKSEGRDPAYGGNGYHLQTAEEMAERFSSEDFNAGCTGLEHVLESVKDISFPDLDSYSYAVPEIVKTDANVVLRSITDAALNNFFLKHDCNLPMDVYESRLQTELQVIRDTEFAQYFLFVRSIVKFCEDNDIFFVARGSASGSLVCFLLGITQLNPIEYDLLFERFLSNDRSKPPDIDLDVEDERRDEVLRFVSQKFETTQIGTVLTYQSKSTQNGVLEQVRKQFPNIANLDDDQLIGLDPVKVFLRGIEGVAKSIGGHPAGVVAETPGKSIRDLVPLFYISSSGRWVTQYDMDDIEALGIVKVDILGVRSLRVIRRNLEHMGQRNWDWIPNDDQPTFRLLQSGQTDGVFTYKGWSSRKGCKALKPKSLNDCSLVAAIYRPSCTELGLDELFLERRKNRWKPPEDWHEAIGKNLQITYGIAVYQEQVIQIMKAFGFTPDEVMVLLRAVKKKDPKLMAVIHKRLNELVDADTAKHVWELMEGYTRYGFNKAHSAAYALVGYRMAYLKAHHPLEFMCATLECETEKTSQTLYMRESRRLGIGILPVDVQASGITWSIHRSSLRRGLTSVTGVGHKAAQALVQARPYTNVHELREKVNGPQCNIGVLKKLAEAGGFLSMGISDEFELIQELEK